MKILHTADVHLQEYNDERWESLKELVALGASQSIDVLVICGDLFDSSAHAHKLRPKIREIFSGLPFTVLIIPGNHDVNAYPEGVFLGERVIIIRDLLTPVRIDNVFFWGFPYEELLPEEILEYLHLAAKMAGEHNRETGAHQTEKNGPHSLPNEPVHILLFHGELLDVIDGWTQYGEEGRQRYLPVKLAYFQNLPWQYILAGHFHTTFSVHPFAENRYFVYSGSPVSVTRRELGQRQVNLFTVGEPPAPHYLKTSYFEKMELKLDPFQEQNPVEVITEKLSELPKNAYLLLEIEGFFNGKQLEMSEEEFHRAISKLIGKRMEIVRMEFRDIREIVEDDVFTAFMERLNAMSLDNFEKHHIIRLTLKAMMEAQS